MTPEEEVAWLRAENTALREQLAAALARIAELEQQPRDPPPFVKPNRPKSTEPKRPRKKRAAQHNRGRRCELPTRTQSHVLERCPECNYRLQGQSVDYRRQVIELPAPAPLEIIEHQIIKRFCPHCRRWRSPQLDLSEQVLGQGRIGVRIASLIAFLSQTLRLPVRRIQAYLLSLHQLHLSSGEIVELRHQMRRTLQPSLESLKQQARASPILHGDETCWRENGTSGYIWAFSTPGEDAVRYYEYDGSRSQQVVHRILGGQFAGHLVSDFYGSYNVYAGKHQRCWVHLLRDLHNLKEQHPQDTTTVEWAQAVRALYDEAQVWLRAQMQPAQATREEQYVGLVARAHALGVQQAGYFRSRAAAAARSIRTRILAGIP